MLASGEPRAYRRAVGTAYEPASQAPKPIFMDSGNHCEPSQGDICKPGVRRLPAVTLNLQVHSDLEKLSGSESGIMTRNHVDMLQAVRFKRPRRCQHNLMG